MVVSGLWWVGLFGIGIWVRSNQAHRDEAGVINDAGRLDFGDVRRGDCVKIPGLQDGATVGAFDITGVPCADTHNAQAIFVINFPDSAYPGEAVIERQDRGRRVDRGSRPSTSSRPASSISTRTEQRWDQSDGHRAICFVTTAAGP